MKNYQLTIYVRLFLLVFACAGAAFLAPRTVRAQDLQTIRFGVLPVVDTLPLVVGREDRLFSQNGINLQLIPFQSALERDAALQAGQIDGYFGDLLNTVLLIHSGQRIGIMTTVFSTHPDYRMFALVTAPGSSITDFAQLKGQAVAISSATVIEYLLDQFLIQQKVAAGFVEKQEIKKMPIRLQMLLAGQVPAALLPEPLVTLAEIKGGQVVMDDRNLNTALTVLALDRNLAQRHKTLRANFLNAYGEAVKRINADPNKYKDLLVKRTRFPEPAKGKYLVPQFPAVGLPAEKDIEAAQKWLLDKKMIKGRIPYDMIVFNAPTP
jgi:NitT/TauT family transport system substrate-binding protein